MKFLFFPPYITPVNFCFQGFGHSFSVKNVIFGWEDLVPLEIEDFEKCLRLIFLLWHFLLLFCCGFFFWGGGGNFQFDFYLNMGEWKQFLGTYRCKEEKTFNNYIHSSRMLDSYSVTCHFVVFFSFWFQIWHDIWHPVGF